MQQAPAWLSYASPVIALIALVFSLLTYSRAGPRVKVKVSTPKDAIRDDDAEFLLTVVVRNTGLAPIQVVGLTFRFASLLVKLTPADAYEGPDIPVTVPGGHREEWVFDANNAVSRMHAAGELSEHYRGGGVLPDLLHALRILWKVRIFHAIAVVADLANGVQVNSPPMFRLMRTLVTVEENEQIRIGRNRNFPKGT